MRLRAESLQPHACLTYDSLNAHVTPISVVNPHDYASLIC